MPDDPPAGRADSAELPRGSTAVNWLEEDPVVRSGRREAFWALGLFLAATIYSVTYCTLWGYKRPVESLSFVLWFPDWVFWGIVAPWLVCSAASIYFAMFVMEDDPLVSSADLPSEDSPPDDRMSGSEASREAGR